MEIRELRIGNYVNYNDGSGKDDIREVVGIDESSITSVVKGCRFATAIKSISTIYAIPLTEEILLKCGFDKVNEFEGYADKKHCLLRTGDCYLFMPFCTEDKDCYIELKHLHQLQNLYFSLTGQELEIKL